MILKRTLHEVVLIHVFDKIGSFQGLSTIVASQHYKGYHLSVIHIFPYKFCTMAKIRILLVLSHYTAKNHILVCKYPLASMQYTLLTWFLGLQFFFLTFHADYFTNWQHLHIWYCRHKRRIYVTTDCQNLIRLMTLNYKIVISFM